MILTVLETMMDEDEGCLLYWTGEYAYWKNCDINDATVVQDRDKRKVGRLFIDKGGFKIEVNN